MTRNGITTMMLICLVTALLLYSATAEALTIEEESMLRQSRDEMIKSYAFVSGNYQQRPDVEFPLRNVLNLGGRLHITVISFIIATEEKERVAEFKENAQLWLKFFEKGKDTRFDPWTNELKLDMAFAHNRQITQILRASRDREILHELAQMSQEE